MAKPEPTWPDIAKRLAKPAWSELRGIGRRAAPSMLGCAGIMLAYMAGHAHVSSWWMLACMVLVGFAIGAAEDRAESRAATAWASKFWGLIETDHVLEISVTHKNETPR